MSLTPRMLGRMFDQASGSDASDIRGRVADRQADIANLRAQGYDQNSARQIWREERTAELRNRGLDDRQVSWMVSQEDRLGMTQERAEIARERAFAQQQARDVRMEEAAMRRADAAARREYAQDRKDGATWGGVLADLAGVKGAGRRAMVESGRAMGGAMSDAGEGGGGYAQRQSAGASRREYEQDRREGATWGGVAADLMGVKGAGRRAMVESGRTMGGAMSDAGEAGGGYTQRQAEAASRREYAQDRREGATWGGVVADLLGVKGAGRRAMVESGRTMGGAMSDGSVDGGTRVVRTYPLQNERPGYVDTGRVQGFSLERSNQITEAQNNAARDGATPEARQQILVAQAAAPRVEPEALSGSKFDADTYARARQFVNNGPGGMA